MTSSHKHSTTGKAVIAGTIDADVAAAIKAHETKFHASPYTLDTARDGWGKFVPLYGPGDTGDRLDTDCMGNLSQVTYNADGSITLVCERKTTPSGRPFAGAAIASYGTFAQKYGTFQARLRYDEAPGTWPSLFLFTPGQKGCCPEVDWLEAYGSTACLGPGKVEHVVYRDAASPSAYTIVPMAAGWHDHKLVWTPTSMDFYIDGIKTWSVPDPSYVPQVPLYLAAIMGVGANNPLCRASSTTPNRLTMDIAYLRVTA